MEQQGNTIIICDVCQTEIKSHTDGVIIWYHNESTHQYCSPHVAHTFCGAKFGFFNDEFYRQCFPLDFAIRPEVFNGILKHLDDTDYHAIKYKVSPSSSQHPS